MSHQPTKQLAVNKARRATLFFITAFAELASIYFALVCLSAPHSAWLLAAVALSSGMFFGLVMLHQSGNQGMYSIYGAVFCASVAAWFWLKSNLLITPVDWCGIAIALSCVVLITWPKRRKVRPEVDRSEK